MKTLIITIALVLSFLLSSCIGMNVNCAHRAGYRIGGTQAHYTAYRY